MPQSDPVPPGPQVTFGRRRSDKLRATIVPETPAKTIGTGLHSAPSRRALVLALCLIAAFALGYVAGVTSVGAAACCRHGAIRKAAGTSPAAFPETIPDGYGDQYGQVSFDM